MSSAEQIPTDKAAFVGYYMNAGVRLVRLKKDRTPRDPDWQKPEVVDHPQEVFEDHVRRGGGLAWQLGEVSNGLAVVDNDWELAVKLAPKFLPKTLCGTKGSEKPSHYAYHSPGLGYRQFNGLDNSRIIDVKASNNGAGHYVAVEPTVHPKKGPYRFVGGGYNPAAIEYVEPGELERQIQLLAVAALIAEHLPASREEGGGGRHDFALTMIGYLLRNGEPEEDVEQVLVAAWEVRGATREALEDIRRAIPDSASRLARDEPVKGGLTLEEAVAGLPGRIAKFLDWKQTAPEGSCKPQVVINGRYLNEVTTDAMAAVLAANDPPRIFVRTGTMARVVLDEDGVPEIQRLSESALRGRMDRVAEFVRVNKDRESEAIVPANPPKIVVEDAMALDRWDGLPPIEAIVETPILRPDGMIFEDGGYDRETRLYYHPASGFEMPAVSESPSKKEVDRALAVVDDAIGEFPFADEASAANARALLLTPIVRQAVQGCVPLALIDKPQMGTGGSLFAEVVSYIGIGRHAEMLGQPAHEDEWRKQITAKLDAGASMVTVDNVDDPLTSSNLSRALTARTWTDRRLGRSEEITLAQRATWLATGNNIELGGDIARRCYWIRLDAKESKPWERQGFKHPNLMAWVESHRGELVHALLTIARSWYTAGCPKDESLPRLGSFEGWAETVGGMLKNAGISGFLSNLDELYESADSQTEEWTGFLETWQEKVGDRSLAAKALADDWITKDGDFKASLPDDLATALDEGTQTFARSLGNSLKKVAGRRHGVRGLYVHKHGMYKRAVRWKVSESNPPSGESHESGESPQPQRGSKPQGEAYNARENKVTVGKTDSPDSPDSPKPTSFYARQEDGLVSLAELKRRERDAEGDAPDAPTGSNRPLTEDEVRQVLQVRQLARQGMSPEIARHEVLNGGKRNDAHTDDKSEAERDSHKSHNPPGCDMSFPGDEERRY